jgi:hypothetical protein
MEKTIVIEKRSKFDTDFEKIAWVLKVRSKDITRKALMCAKVEENTIVCTDGNRLHSAKIDRAIPDGLYNVKSANVKMIVLELNEEGYTYPDYKRCFQVEADFTTHKAHYTGNKSRFVHDIYRKFSDDTYLYDLAFLEDAYMENADVSMSHKEGMTPLYLYDEKEGRKALVMPMKV